MQRFPCGSALYKESGTVRISAKLRHQRSENKGGLSAGQSCMTSFYLLCWHCSGSTGLLISAAAGSALAPTRLCNETASHARDHDLAQLSSWAPESR